MEMRTVTVVGGLGNPRVGDRSCLLEKGARVRAVVRATSSRAKLEALGVTDFVVADLRDPESLQQAMTAEPRPRRDSERCGLQPPLGPHEGDNSRRTPRGIVT